MVRQEDNSIKAFHNVCPHRGNRLVHNDNGSSPVLHAPIMVWKFNNAGILVYAPGCRRLSSKGNPWEKINLTEIPCEIYGGFIWYNMDENCSSLFDFLGEVKENISICIT